MVRLLVWERSLVFVPGLVPTLGRSGRWDRRGWLLFHNERRVLRRRQFALFDALPQMAQVILIPSSRGQSVQVNEGAHVTASAAVAKIGDGRHHVTVMDANDGRKPLVTATIEPPVMLTIKKRR
jgi:hypothetical protein